MLPDVDWTQTLHSDNDCCYLFHERVWDTDSVSTNREHVYSRDLAAFSWVVAQSLSVALNYVCSYLAYAELAEQRYALMSVSFSAIANITPVHGIVLSHGVSDHHPVHKTMNQSQIYCRSVMMQRLAHMLTL